MTTRVGNGRGDYITVEDGPEFVPSRRGIRVDGILQSVRDFATLSEALRILGASVLLASMSLFLLQGWNEGNDVRRYLLLLTQTGLLTAAGFAMSHVLKETKGARMFFGLALVSVPANFTILGALLYSVFQWDGGLTTYPGYATWQIENVAATGITLAGAMVVLLPVTFFCFAVMARHSAKLLSLHFLALNALLLLPIRSSMAAGTIALLGVVYALRVVSVMAGKDRALKTGEGRFALTTLFIPLGIILFRSMYFYRVDALLVAMVCMAFYLAARQASLFPGRRPQVALMLDVFSLPLALGVAMFLTNAVSQQLAGALEAPFFAAVYTGLALDLLRRTESKKLTSLISFTISLFIALSFIFSVALTPAAGTAILALVAGGLLLLFGIALGNVTAISAGTITIIAGVMFGFGEIVQLIVSSGWVELAIFGAAAIALGSVLERHGVAIKLRLVNWFDGFGERRREVALDQQ
jgi:hypothetical protein